MVESSVQHHDRYTLTLHPDSGQSARDEMMILSVQDREVFVEALLNPLSRKYLN